MSCAIGLIIYLFIGIVLGIIIKWALDENKKQEVMEK